MNTTTDITENIIFLLIIYLNTEILKGSNLPYACLHFWLLDNESENLFHKGFSNKYLCIPNHIHTGSKQEKEHVKAVYSHPAYLTYMQRIS